MADQSRNRTPSPARRRAGHALAALAIVGVLIGSATTSAPAEASDRLTRAIGPALVGAAIYYGMTHGQRAHYYDRSYYFDPRYYYYDDRRGHWQARNHQRRHHAQKHRRRDHARDHRRHDRRKYSHNRYRDDGYGFRDHDRRGRDRDRHSRRDRRDRDRDHDRRGGRRH